MYKKILLAIDNTADSKRAIEKVISLQKQFQSRVSVFHTISTHVMPITNVGIMNLNYYPSRMQSTTEIVNSRRTAGEKLLQKTAKMFKEQAAPVDLRLIEDESPDDYILEAIEKEKFDLIVLGCEGHHSKLRRVLSDTVPDKVLNTAPVDVLIIR